MEARHGVMRNYLIPSNTLVCTPEIIKAKDGEPIRAHQQLIVGAASIQLTQNKRLSLLLIKAIFILVLSGLFVTAQIDSTKSWQETLAAITLVSAGALIMTGSLFQLLYLVGYLRLRRMFRKLCVHPNQFYLPSLEQASKNSHPLRIIRMG